MKESKKFFLATSLLATSICGLNAQMTVTENGQTIFGNRYKTSSTATPVSQGVMSDASSSAPGTLIGANDPVSVDTLASAVFLGKGANKGNAYITFGTGSRVSVGEAVTNATKPTGVLDLYGEAGFQLVAQGGTVFRFACNTSTGKLSQFRFYTDVAAPSFITTSDYRLKHDVESVGEDYRALWDLNPVSYRLNGSNDISDTPGQNPQAFEISDGATDTAVSSSADDRIHYGFIAQEVREIFPELVIEDENGILGIDYQGFIPLLVEAVKNLRIEVSEQAEEIARLKGEGTPDRIRTTGVTDTRVELISAGATLGQNRPNPFSSTTEIDCCIPESVQEAVLYVFDLQGQTVETVTVADRGKTKVSMDGSRLHPGMYLYTLVADGMEIDTKRMILRD